MALLKVTAELLALKVDEPLEDVCKKIAKKHGIEELEEGETWADTIDPAVMPYAVHDGVLYLISEMDVNDAEETYAVMELDEEGVNTYFEAVIDDEQDISLKEVFQIGFESLNGEG
jgi:hypothetical protein